MIRHILRFRWSATVDEQRLVELLSHLKSMATMDAVADAVIGADVGDPSDGFTHAACFTLADIEAYASYMNDPLHRAADVEGLPLLDRIMSFDLIDDSDLDLAARIREIQEQRLASDPELRAMHAEFVARTQATGS